MPNFNKTTWKEDNTTPITAAQLNRLETAISFAQLEKLTSDWGGVKISASSPGVDDLLAMIVAAGIGVHTFYAVEGNNLSAWPGGKSIRGFAHITSIGPAHGYLIAFDYANNVFSNYVVAGSWTGWKVVSLAEPPYLSAKQTTDKSIPAAQYTILNPPVQNSYGGGTYTGGKYIVPFDGLYMVKGYFACTPTAGMAMHMAAYVNDALDELNRMEQRSASGAGDGMLLGSTIIRCVAGDVIDVRVYLGLATTLTSNAVRFARVG